MCSHECDTCSLYHKNNGVGVTCYEFISRHPEAIERIGYEVVDDDDNDENSKSKQVELTAREHVVVFDWKETYTCPSCGGHVEKKTPYCPYCGKSRSTVVSQR